MAHNGVAAEPLGGVQGGVAEHDEVIATEASDHRVFADGRLDPARDHGKYPVSDHVTASVVDRLESVEIEQH